MKKIILSLFLILVISYSFGQKIKNFPNEILVETRNYNDIDFEAIEKEIKQRQSKKVKLTVKRTVPCNNVCGYSTQLYSVLGKPKDVLKSMKKYCLNQATRV